MDGLLFALHLLRDVRITRGERDGIQTFEVTVGDYQREWETEEAWRAVEERMAAERIEGVKIVEEARDPQGRFRRYVVEGSDIQKGRL